jgi:type I restriction enzyme S subunit
MRLPDGWKTGSVASFGKLVTGSTPSTADEANFNGAIPFVTPGDLGGSGPITKAARSLSELGASRSRRIPRGAALVVCIGSTIGKTGRAGCEVVTNQQINAVIPNDETHGDFAYYEINRIAGQFRRLAGTQAVPILSKGEFGDFPVNVPPLPEQRKIAGILTTWDEALEKLDALIAAKDRRKQALMQRLLSGKRRIEGSKGPVKFRRASELFTNRSERNSSGLPILSVTQDQGVVLRSSLDRRIRHDEETNGTYKIVRKGDFVISLRSFQGGLEYSEIEGAVSPAYHIIHPISPISQRFYRHYFKSPDFIGRLAIAVIGIRDGKQISFTDFGFIRIPYLHPEDQQRIAALLDTCDAELDLLRRQRDALDLQKRGLMQRLLTGKIRVEPDPETT